MKALIAILIFCIILFIYIHIYFHLKVSNDLEVYEIEQPSKEKLEEICDIRQPVIFNYLNDRLLNDCSIDAIASNYGAFDIKVRNRNYNSEENELYLPFTMNAGIEIFNKDKKGRYFSENNYDFLQETGILKTYRYNDSFLRPPMVSNCDYDFIFGSINTTTPLRYELNYRNYYLNTGDDVKIKLIPPIYCKYLYVQTDYSNFEFVSNLNVWNVQHEYKADFDKVKSLEIVLKKGQIIYIPSYWFYSFQLSEKSSLCVFKYKTYMNTCAISNHLFMNFLQRNNTKHEMVKKMDLTQNQTSDIENNKEL